MASSSQSESTGNRGFQTRASSSSQSRLVIRSPWVDRLRPVGCQDRRPRGRLIRPSWDLKRREEKIISSSTCVIRTWDDGEERVKEINSPEIRTPDVSQIRVNNNISLSSSERGDRSVESSQPDGWINSQGFRHIQHCSAGKGLHQEVQGAFPLPGIKNIPWSTGPSSFDDTCGTSSPALIKNLHCNNIEVSRPLVLENNSDANQTAISGKYAHREKILHVNKYNSQTFSGVEGIHKNGQVCKQLEIADGNSGLSVGTPNHPKTENFWTSRFKEKSLPNKAIEGGSNIDGPLQGSSEDVIVRSITKDKGVHEIHPYSRKEKQPTLSSLLWRQHWRCSNVRVTQKLMKTCLDPNQKWQSNSVIKGSIDSNTSDASGS